MVNDTISDMLTRIRNANLASKTRVSVPTTHVHRSICEILEREGFIETFSSSDTDSNELTLQFTIFISEMFIAENATNCNKIDPKNRIKFFMVLIFNINH